MNKEKLIFIIGLIIMSFLGFLFFFSLTQLLLNLLNQEHNSDLTLESRKWLFNTFNSIVFLSIVSIIYEILDVKIFKPLNKKFNNNLENLNKKFNKYFKVSYYLMGISYLIIVIYVFIVAYSMVFLPIEEHVKLYNPFTSIFSTFLFILLNIGIILAVIGLWLFLKISKVAKNEINF